MTLINEFAGSVYRTRLAMIDAIAEKWLTRNGKNSPQEIATIIAETSVCQQAQECYMAYWGSSAMAMAPGEYDYDKRAVENKPTIAELELAMSLYDPARH